MEDFLKMMEEGQAQGKEPMNTLCNAVSDALMEAAKRAAVFAGTIDRFHGLNERGFEGFLSATKITLEEMMRYYYKKVKEAENEKDTHRVSSNITP